MRRVTRLEPPWVLSLVLFTMVLAIGLHGLPTGYLWHALASLFYSHNLAYGEITPASGVSWSLEIEIQFYLLSPLLMHIYRLRSKYLRRVLLAVAIVAGGLLQSYVQASPRASLSILAFGVYFLAGLLTADFFIVDIAPALESGREKSFLFDGVALVALTFSMCSSVALYLLPFAYFLLIVAAFRSKIFARFLNVSWVATIGGMCYTIYLIHMTVIPVFFRITRHLLHFKNFLFDYSIQLLCLIPPTLLLSIAFFAWIERPCMNPEWPTQVWQRLMRLRDKSPGKDFATTVD